MSETSLKNRPKVSPQYRKRPTSPYAPETPRAKTRPRHMWKTSTESIAMMQAQAAICGRNAPFSRAAHAMLHWRRQPDDTPTGGAGISIILPPRDRASGKLLSAARAASFCVLECVRQHEVRKLTRDSPNTAITRTQRVDASMRGTKFA